MDNHAQQPNKRVARGARRWAWLAVVPLTLLVGVALAQSGDDFDDEPIRYTTTPATDPVAQLQQRLDRGELTLRPEGARGYLQPVLRALNVPASSQILVFSKTSFQREHISPLTPRALYFNEQTSVGWVQGGPVLEFAAQDPQLGVVFYTLNQDDGAKPRFVRQTHECLSCHSSSLTRGVPGFVMRSVFPARDGQPLLTAGTFLSTDQSPLKERWGGWYVTGTHGSQRHLGNTTCANAAAAEDMDMDAGANVTDLRRYFSTTPYLTRHSDIVALLVMEHQSAVSNLIVRAGYETRRALYSEAALQRELGPTFRSESTQSRIRSVAEPLVRALLLSKEAPLTEPVQGTSRFAEEFSAQGPKDPAGRSLRDLDLQHRLFKYPCSYLIYSQPFRALPAPARAYVYRRLHEILTGKDTSPEFAHLTETDRRAVLEILRATHPEFAAWREERA